MRSKSRQAFRTSRHGAKRKRRSRPDILRRIVEAATEEFNTCGFAGATIAAIAGKADVTETQLFRYFPSKSALFRETIFNPLDQHLLNFIASQAANNPGKAGIREQNALYTTELQQFIREHVDMFTSLVVAEKYGAAITHGVSRINSLAAYFEHCTDSMAKRMRRKPRVDPRLMVRVTFAAVLGCVMFREWIFPRGLAKDDEIAEAINDFVLEGITANFG